MLDTQTTGLTLNELTTICNGEIIGNESNSPYMYFEVKPVHLLLDNRDQNVFIVITKERWNLGQFYEMPWSDRRAEAIQYQDHIGLVIVEKKIENLDPRVKQLIVSDSLQAMRDISTAARNKMHNPVIAITGTVGKSTLTFMLEHVLKASAKTVVKNRGNHNTNRGVPLYAINLIGNPDYGIFEMSMNAFNYSENNKRRNVTETLLPDYAIVTSAGVGHMLGRNTTEDIAKVKARIFEGLKPTAIAIINRDITDYKIIEQKARLSTQNIFTYSAQGNKEADVKVKGITYLKNSMEVDVDINGELYKYELSIPSLGMVESSLGCLLLCNQLGIPFELFKERIFTFKHSTKVMEEKEIITPSGKKINILDDTHNAAVPSMINLIDVFNEKKQFYNGRKILILGQINELGAVAVKYHREFVAHIEKVKPDYVFLYGYLMQELAERLPKAINSSWYPNLDGLIETVAKVADEDSFIAMKGSVSGSDFQQISEKLPNYLMQHTAAENEMVVLNKLSNSGLINLVQPDFQKIDLIRYGYTGLSHLVVIYEALRRVAIKKHKLNEYVAISDEALKAKNQKKSIGFQEGEIISLQKLIVLAATFNAPDAIVALAHHIFKGKRATKEIAAIGKSMGIDEFSLKNVTGRAVQYKVQRYKMSDLTVLLQQFVKLPKYLLELLQPHPIEHNHRILKPITRVQQKGVGYASLMWGAEDTEGVILAEKNHQWHAAVITGAQNAFDRDAALIEVLDEPQNVAEKVHTLTSPIINILGDTYFGEDYTEKRKRNGKIDALMKYGYGHSFGKISSFFGKQDFNLFNFEAVFIEEGRKSELAGVKGFLLGAKANETIEELKKHHVSAVSLATNHTMDYGREPLIETVKQFESNDILTMGAGATSKEAYEPIILKYGDKEIALFNGYWYRNPPYDEYDFYALGNKAGVACLSGSILKRLQQYRLENPNARIIVIAHWGIDFKDVLEAQRKFAMNLIDCGADLIIGHGPHMMQRAGAYKGKKVIYSIGNGVFNSNGEYEKQNQLPYSFVVKLDLEKEIIKLYPIFCDNLQTFWQPTFVTEKQMDIVAKRQQEWGSILKQADYDEFGWYFKLNM